VPRANKAVSRERPEGSPASLAREDYSVMQQARILAFLAGVNNTCGAAAAAVGQRTSQQIQTSSSILCACFINILNTALS
jgi:hypothetical protein